MLTLKSASYFAALLGLAAILWLTQRHGISDIRGLLQNAGWPLLVLVPFHALPLLLDVIGWRVLLAPRDTAGRARIPYLFWATTIREAVARLLPLAGVGGELVGIRLGMLRGLDGALVTASIVIQLLLSFVNQYLFALMGLALMLQQPGAQPLVHRIAVGLAIAAPFPLLGMLALRNGRVFERAHGLLKKLVSARLQKKIGLDGAALDDEIRAYLRQTPRLIAATAWEFASLTLGAFENYLALRLLGHPVDLITALTLEAVTQTVRRLFFMMPGGLGVQEAGLVVFAPLLGVPADFAIALSLTKRMREVLFGVPALVSWHWLEKIGKRDRLAARRTPSAR